MFISVTGTITNVEVSIVNLKHPNPQDLSMILVPPTGTGILLSAFSKINNYSYTSGLSYTFSNKASEDKYLYNRSVTDNYVNIYNKTGIFPNTPLVSSLSQLQSISPSGNWSLIINDNDPGGSGYITDWNLVITYLPPSYIE
jgi:subtilisin-like proprotein convertase family protein